MPNRKLVPSNVPAKAVPSALHSLSASTSPTPGGPKTRAMALAGALCCVVHAFTGFAKKSLRGLEAGLLGNNYSVHQMTHDLRRLRLHGMILAARGQSSRDQVG